MVPAVDHDHYIQLAGLEPVTSLTLRFASGSAQSGYSSFRQARGSSAGPFGVRSSREL